MLPLDGLGSLDSSVIWLNSFKKSLVDNVKVASFNVAMCELLSGDDSKMSLTWNPATRSRKSLLQ